MSTATFLVDSCSKCGVERPKTALNFVKDSRHPSGLSRTCRVCHRKMASTCNARKYYDIDRYLCHLVAQARCRARATRTEFALVRADARALYDAQAGLCAITRVPMTFDRSESRHVHPTNVSLDRLNPNVGYVAGNVQLVCFVINMMKGEMPMDELTTWCRRVLDA